MRARLALVAALVAGAAAAADSALPMSDAKALHRAQPQYPKAALKKDVQGCVAVAFDLDAEGLADHYVVLESQPKGVFDMATLKALNGWRWEKGKPGHQVQVITYQISGKEAQAPKCETHAPVPAAASQQTLQILQKVMPDLSGVSGEGGCVTVEMVITHDGFVGDIVVLDAKPAVLADPAVAALKQWWFQSFPPPDRTTVQTFYFAPDQQVRLPDNALQAPFLSLSGEGGIKNSGCGTGKADSVRGAQG